MAKKDILPAVSKYSHELSDTVIAKAACGDIDAGYEKELLAKVSKLNTAAYKKTEKLEQAVLKAKEISETQELSMYSCRINGRFFSSCRIDTSSSQSFAR